ncbi:MAG: TrbI/VirB10 family protein [Crenarchaeota archaeon]|jgi:type IV secretion system protein VirB10|nr:TrbI/VirB10 family protein [Thermoproteota archaeon]
MSIFKRSEPELNSDLQPEDFTSMADKVGDSGVEPSEPNLQTTKKSNTGKVGIYAVMLVALAGLLIGLFSFFGKGNKPLIENTPTEPTTVGNTKPKTFDLKLPDPPPPAPTVTKTEETGIKPPEEQNAIIYNTPTAEVEKPNRLLTGSVLLPVNTTSRSMSQNDGVRESYDTPLSNRLHPTVTANARAKHRNDLTYLLKKGTNIGCTLDTKIVTTHPGITRCLVNKDVYSSNGKVLLIERGSEIIGEQTTSMLQGQAKVFVLWNTITTPHGVTLDIASPSADALGASGQDAQVDRHFWQRFGGAIMLSLIDDGLVILGDRINRNHTSVTYDNTSDTIESMAAEALRNTINIPPTGYVNQGELLNVMVARDVDFSSVYELVTPRFY